MMIDTTKADALKEILKSAYGYYDAYYELSDAVIVQALVEVIHDLSDEHNDPFETPDNKAADLAAFYRVLRYYLTAGDYSEIVMGLAKKAKDDFPF